MLELANRFPKITAGPKSFAPCALTDGDDASVVVNLHTVLGALGLDVLSTHS